MHAPVHHWNRWRVWGGAFAVVAAVCAAAVFHIRTFAHAADCVVILAAVAAYVVGFALACWIRPRAAGIAAGAVLTAPVLAVFLSFRWLAFVAFFIIPMIVLEMMNPPEQTQELSATLSCRVYGWGAAMTDEGYTVYVYRHPPFFPFLQVEAAHVTVDQSDPGAEPRSASCASVAASLRR